MSTKKGGDPRPTHEQLVDLFSRIILGLLFTAGSRVLPPVWDWVVEHVPRRWLEQWFYVPVLFVVLVLGSGLLYRLRERKRRIYGYAEVAIGAATIVGVLIDFHDYLGVFALAGACYVIVRGLDNGKEGRKKESATALHTEIVATLASARLTLNPVEKARLIALTEPAFLEELADALRPPVAAEVGRTALATLLLGRPIAEIDLALATCMNAPQP